MTPIVFTADTPPTAAGWAARPPAPPVSSMPAPRREGLSRSQRAGVLALVVALHLAALWAVLQIPAVAEAAREVSPVLVSFIAAPTPPAAPPALKAPPPPPQQSPPMPPQRAPLVSAPPAPTPTAFDAPPASAEPAPVPTPATPTAAADLQAAPHATPAPANAPKVLPSEAVQYLIKPPLVFPPTSIRLREFGTTAVRVHIDEQGLPRDVRVHQSSGHARLDAAAVAAVKMARFKPYTEAGRPLPAVATIALVFDPEN